MGCPFKSLGNMNRRSFLKGFGGVAVAAGAGYGARYAMDSVSGSGGSVIIPFLGTHQAGITTDPQNQTYFATFDLIASRRDDIVKLMKAWTQAASRMTEGKTAQPLQQDLSKPAGDNGDALGLSPAKLTLTFGFGPGIFIKDGKDRYNLAKQRPEALVDLPKFNGDQLVESKSGGDISVQACADDPQVAFHAVRELTRLATDIAQIRWVQTGFASKPASGETPRNLQGFKDGTQNPKAQEFDKFVWVGSEGPSWMQGGSYMVVRKIRIALEHWESVGVNFQEQTIGRYKDSGAPLGKKNEFDVLDLDAVDKDGNFIIPESAHVRLGAAAANDGVQILRRGYSYNDGINFIAERWPPWRQGLEYDAGLLFMCYQRDPRTGFIKIFENMAKLDALNQFVTHTGSGLFACPRGVGKGEYIGQGLFEAA